MRVTSGVRCPEHNQKVGGSVVSPHMQGLAVDLAAADGMERFLLVDLAIAAGFRRVGVGRDFVHMDLSREHPRPRLWTY